MKFLNDHWEKLSLIGLFIFLVFVNLHVIHHGDADSREWSQTIASQVLSALLGFSAGKIAGRSSELPKPPEPPAESKA